LNLHAAILETEKLQFVLIIFIYFEK